MTPKILHSIFRGTMPCVRCYVSQHFKLHLAIRASLLWKVSIGAEVL